MEIEMARSKISKDGVLLLFTDAFFERQNSLGEMFGLERLQDLVGLHHERDADEILQIVFETVYEFGKPAKWDDDATLIVVKRIA